MSPDTVVSLEELPELFKSFLVRYDDDQKKYDNDQKTYAKDQEEAKLFRQQTRQEFEDLRNTMDQKFQKTVEAIVSSSPGSVLQSMQVQFLDEGLTGAIIGKAGHGSATWTYVQRGNGAEFYAMSCAHCAFFSMMADKIQFVAIPEQLAKLVEGVCLHKESFCFGSSYEGARDADILFLKLKGLPDSVDKEKVLDWHDDMETYIEGNIFTAAYIAGDSLKSSVTGSKVVYDNVEKRFAFALNSFPEPGHSGTAMVAFTAKNGSEFILAMDGEQKRYKTPRLVGVYTGKFQPAEGLEFRGSVCPLPARNMFDLKTLEDISMQKVLLYEKSQPYSWIVHKLKDSRPDAPVFELIREDVKKQVCGVFIEAVYADAETRERKRLMASRGGQDRSHFDSRKKQGPCKPPVDADDRSTPGSNGDKRQQKVHGGVGGSCCIILQKPLFSKHLATKGHVLTVLRD